MKRQRLFSAIRRQFFLRPLVFALGGSFPLAFFLLCFRPAARLWYWLVPLGVCLLFFLLFLLTRSSSDKRRLFLLLSFALLIPALLLFRADRLLEKKDQLLARYDTGTFSVVFAVKESRTDGIVQRVEARTLSVAGEAVTFDFAFYDYGDDILSPGDVAQGCFAFKDASPNPTPNGSYALAQNLMFEATVKEEPVFLTEETPPLSLTFALWRYRLASLIAPRMPKDAAGLMKALLFADKSDLDPALKAQFSSLGVSHLLAVSGLHLSIVTACLAWALDRLGVGKRKKILVLCAVIALYLVLTGFSLSLLRAGGMLFLSYLSCFVKRRRDPLNALFAAAGLMVLVSPASLLDPAFLLSFSSTAGILLIAGKIQRAKPATSASFAKRILKKLGAFVFDSAVVTIAATTFSLPILWLFDGKLFLLTLVSNLLLAPFFTLLLFLLVFFLITLPLSSVNGMMGWLFGLAADAMSGLAGLLAPLSFANLPLSYRFVPYLLILLFLALLVLSRLKKPALLLVPLLVFLLTAPLCALVSDQLAEQKEYFLAVGDGNDDAMLFAEGCDVLAVSVSDANTFTDSLWDEAEAIHPALTIRALCLTGGNISMVTRLSEWKERGLEVLFYPDNKGNSPDIAAAGKRAGLTVFLYHPGDHIAYGDIDLCTCPERYESEDASVAAMAITMGGRRYLYLEKHAPEVFDIRFGVMQTVYPDVLIYGGAGKTIATPSLELPYAPNVTYVILSERDILHRHKDNRYENGRYLTVNDAE